MEPLDPSPISWTRQLHLQQCVIFTRLLTHVRVHEPPETEGRDGRIALLELSGGHSQ